MNCEYCFNKQAWMTRTLFKEYDRSFDIKNVEIVLIVDDSYVHLKVIEGLQNVDLLFFPPNMT